MSLSSTPNWYQRIVLLIKKTMKKKKKASLQQPNMIPSLSDDLLLTCFALISRLYYPTLSLVCKRFRSLIASPELYETRSLLGRTESCLYVCLRFPPDTNTRWYTLCLKPDHTGKKKKNKKKKGDENSSGKLLVPVSIQNSPPSEWSTLVAVGPYIYAISGSIEVPPFSNVPFLDCRTHTWLEAPRLRVVHTNMEYHGKMYLPGKGENPESLNGIEVFDTKTQTWKPVPPERREFKDETMEGKMILENVNNTPGESGMAYNLKEIKIELIESNTYFNRVSSCIIEDVIYYYTSGTREIVWDAKMEVNGVSKGKLKGLYGLPKFSSDCKNVLLAEHGGNLVVLWDEFVGKKDKVICCAEISLVRYGDGEIWVDVEWCNPVLTVPKAYKFVHALSATL